ncbi:MAG: hypothetical protein OIN87_11850 [Candidatus Methanoperedens sp.]|nr:hypothetical protein [Candidatus Methanoperedens sp.]
MYELVSFVNRSRIRKSLIQNIEEPHTPTELSEIIKNHRSTLSRAILELEKKGLVKCITPNEKMGRYYQISDEGRKILEIIKKRDQNAL